ncbi:MAG: 4-hydroxy-tetrahydrodipicolinate synthase [Pseudomonadota bacterium]
MFAGSIPALVTPFRDGAVDKPAFANLVERQVAAGSGALVPMGTTGETSTLSHDEHKSVVSLCVEVAAGRVPVIAGAGANSTTEAIELTIHAKAVGADAALVVVPYYNKPDQRGIFAHFKAINDAVQLPVFLYNVPGRTVVDLLPDTVIALAELPNIIGIKDASDDLARVAQHAAGTQGQQFIQLSGHDPSALGFCAQGGAGVISVTANVAPEAMAKMVDAAVDGRLDEARAIDASLSGLHSALFASPSPGPSKFALSAFGLCTADVRLPLLPPDDAAQALILSAMQAAGLKD